MSHHFHQEARPARSSLRVWWRQNHRRVFLHPTRSNYCRNEISIFKVFDFHWVHLISEILYSPQVIISVRNALIIIWIKKTSATLAHVIMFKSNNQQVTHLYLLARWPISVNICPKICNNLVAYNHLLQTKTHFNKLLWSTDNSKINNAFNNPNSSMTWWVRSPRNYWCKSSRK